MSKKVILASTSPRRKELLGSILWDFDICSPYCEEKDGESPEATALDNARNKAYSVCGESGAIIIACDTVVACGGKILGKPKDAAEAAGILEFLRGRRHEVLSGVCVLADKEYLYYERSYVSIKNMSGIEIRDYVKNYCPFDKAGAYGIQDGVAETYEGDYNNIVGMPLDRLRKILRENGIDVKE